MIDYCRDRDIERDGCSSRSVSERESERKPTESGIYIKIGGEKLL